MKKQTYIACFKDENNNLVTFERFTCKGLKRVVSCVKVLLNSDLYMVCVEGTKTVEIYATLDGYHIGMVPEYTMIV